MTLKAMSNDQNVPIGGIQRRQRPLEIERLQTLVDTRVDLTRVEFLGRRGHLGLRASSASNPAGDPVPRPRRQAGAPRRIEPVDGLNQPDYPILERIVDIMRHDPQRRHSQRHQRQRTTDELLTGGTVTPVRSLRQPELLVDGQSGHLHDRSHIHCSSVPRSRRMPRPRCEPLWTTGRSARSVDGARSTSRRSVAERSVADLPRLLLQCDQFTELTVVFLELLDGVGALELGLDLIDASRHRAVLQGEQ